MAAQLLNLGDFTGIAGMGDISPTGLYPDMYGFGTMPPGAEFYNNSDHSGYVPSLQFYLQSPSSAPAETPPSKQYYSPQTNGPHAGSPAFIAQQGSPMLASTPVAFVAASDAQVADIAAHEIANIQMAATATISGYGAGHGGNVVIFPGNPSNGNSPTGPNFTPHNWDTYRRQAAPTRQNPVNPAPGPINYDGSGLPIIQITTESEWMRGFQSYGGTRGQINELGNQLGIGIDNPLYLDGVQPIDPNWNQFDEHWYWGAGDFTNV